MNHSTAGLPVYHQLPESTQHEKKIHNTKQAECLAEWEFCYYTVCLCFCGSILISESWSQLCLPDLSRSPGPTQSAAEHLLVQILSSVLTTTILPQVSLPLESHLPTQTPVLVLGHPPFLLWFRPSAWP